MRFILPFLIAAGLSTAGCGLTTKQAETAVLEAANAAIVSAAHDIDAIEAREESACDAGPREQLAACVTRARRWNDVLRAYDAWRVAWAALTAAWNNPAATPEQVTKAQAAVETTRARFWLCNVAAEMGGAR